MTILVAQDNQQPVAIPEWVVDLDSFRQWACSDEFPRSGWHSHLGGKLWVDTSIETVWHNQLKGKITHVLTTLVEATDTGSVFPDRMLLTNAAAELSTEPDAMYVTHESFASGRAHLEEGEESMEILGAPDMVLEVVSRSSRQKDRVVLRELYHRAEIREYWLAEHRGGEILFEILVWQPEGYVAATSPDGWIQSPVFGRNFRLTVTSNTSGLPIYLLEVR